MAARQTVKENLQCTSKYGHLRISQDICHVRMTDIEGFLTIYGHSGNLLNNNFNYIANLLEVSIFWRPLTRFAIYIVIYLDVFICLFFYLIACAFCLSLFVKRCKVLL